eukprot:2816631-Prymnesium_polylepis.1
MYPRGHEPTGDEVSTVMTSSLVSRGTARATGRPSARSPTHSPSAPPSAARRPSVRTTTNWPRGVGATSHLSVRFWAGAPASSTPQTPRR